MTELYIQGLRWVSDNGDQTLRLDYDLNENSIVFDVGGYRGDFTSAIFNKYNCNVYVFEPMPASFDGIEKRFSNNSKVRRYCFGLSETTATQKISSLEGNSSLFIDDNSIEVNLVSISDFIHCFDSIDLIKINVEGAEYSLLESLIQNNLITRFKNIQVQFHDFIPNARERMLKIQEQLLTTHELTYQYEFVWENWKIRETLS